MRSQFLNDFLKSDRAWNDAAKSSWAADVETRLRSVVAKIEPKPPVLGYTVRRQKNSVSICTVTPEKLSKQDIAVLTAGRWPCWKQITAVVPELARSTDPHFNARARLEWERRWNVDIEIARLAAEDGIFR